MTNLEAIKANVGYPLSDNSFILALTNNGISQGDTYIQLNQSFELAFAECLYIILTSPNVSEGGYTISLSEKKMIQEMANAIHEKYGVKVASSPTAKYVQKW